MCQCEKNHTPSIDFQYAIGRKKNSQKNSEAEKIGICTVMSLKKLKLFLKLSYLIWQQHLNFEIDILLVYDLRMLHSAYGAYKYTNCIWGLDPQKKNVV